MPPTHCLSILHFNCPFTVSDRSLSHDRFSRKTPDRQTGGLTNWQTDRGHAIAPICFCFYFYIFNFSTLIHYHCPPLNKIFAPWISTVGLYFCDRQGPKLTFSGVNFCECADSEILQIKVLRLREILAKFSNFVFIINISLSDKSTILWVVPINFCVWHWKCNFALAGTFHRC